VIVQRILLALAGLLVSCGGSQPPPVSNAASASASNQTAPLGLWQVTLRFEETPSESATNDEPPPWSGTLSVARPGETAETIPLGEIRGGTANFTTRGLPSVSTYFAGAGDEIALDREGDALVVRLRAVGEDLGEPRRVASVPVPADAAVHYTLLTPADPSWPSDESPCPGGTTVFACSMDPGQAYLCLIDDRIRLGVLHERMPAPEVLEVPKTRAAEVLTWYREVRTGSDHYEVATVTVEGHRYVFIDESADTKRTSSVSAGFEKPREPLKQCAQPGTADFDPLGDLVAPTAESPAL
jgi:hypothetical protein